MSNYNTTLQSNNTDLQMVLQTLQTKAAGGEQATPVITVNNSNGLITATAGTKTSTHQLAFQAAKTITPSTASQIAVSSGYYTGGNITVAAIPSTYVQPTGTKTVTTNGTHDVKNYASVNVSVASSGGNTDVEDSLITRDMTTYTNDRVTTIGIYAFYSYRSLTSVSFPAVTSIGSYAFAYCHSLTSVSFPKVTSIGNNAFIDCSSLTSVSFPKVTSIGNNAFYYCTKLTSASFPKVTSIGGYVFQNCYNLKSLYLTGSSVCTLSKSNAFSSTPIGGYSKSAGTYGSIYVPASLLASYKAATNWRYFSSRFVAFDSAGGGDTGGIISFTIDGTEYQAEESMTWAEWVDSEYNTGGYRNSYSRIQSSVGYAVEYSDSTNVHESDTIIANEVYKLSSQASGGI